MGTLQRFWSQGTGQKVAVIAVAGFIVLVGCCGLLVFGGAPCSGLFIVASQGARSGCLPAGQQVSTAAATSPVSATPTAVATRTPASPTPTVYASEPPALGAPLSDFVAAYGQPVTNSAGVPTWWADQAQMVLIAVGFANGRATSITMSGPTVWTKAQTFNYCMTWLPLGALEYNSVGAYTDYHSSVGDLVLANYGNGACLLSFAG